MDDRELLHLYVQNQSEPAFAELVTRHVNLVYGTALRLVREPHAAQDVVQAVFILLARKAWSVRDGAALPGWLYRATYRVALDSLRSEQRRRQRETHAMNLAENNTSSSATWANLAPLLDEAMQTLNSTDQNALVLRYFQDKSIRQTSQALGLSEAAAQKRLTRSLEKIRGYFARRGVAMATTTLATVITANSSQAAPLGLAAKVTTASLTSASVASGTGLIKSLQLFFYMNTKSNLALAAAILLAAALNTYQYQFNNQLESDLAAAQKSVAKPRPRPAVQSPSRNTVITEDDDELQLELSILRPPGVPTILRKVGAKFYPLTLDEMIQDPNLMKQFTGHFGSMSGNFFDILQKIFPSTADQQTVAQILGDRNVQTELLMLDISQPNLTAAELADFTQKRKAIFDAAKAKILALAPNDDARVLYTQYQQAQELVPEQQVMDSFTAKLASNQSDVNLALSPEQRDALVKIIQEESTQPDQPDPYESKLASMTGSMDILAAQRQALAAQILQRSAEILTPAQYAVYAALQPQNRYFFNTSVPLHIFGVTQVPTSTSETPAAKTGQLVVLPPGNISGGASYLKYSVKSITSPQ